MESTEPIEQRSRMAQAAKVVAGLAVTLGLALLVGHMVGFFMFAKCKPSICGHANNVAPCAVNVSMHRLEQCVRFALCVSYSSNDASDKFHELLCTNLHH
jgi:hypothetical protein